MDLTDNLYEGKNLKKTREGLPKITQETIDLFHKEMQEDNEKGICVQSRIEKLSKQLESENPTLFCHIHEIISPYPPDLQGVTFARFILFYDLLKRQLINDNLSAFNRIYKYFEQTEDNKTGDNTK